MKYPPARMPYLTPVVTPKFAVALLLTAILTVTSFQTANAAGSSNPPSDLGHHKVQVSDPAVAAQVIARGGQLIADYGSYQLYDVAQPVSDLTTNALTEDREEYNFIMLNTGYLDTRTPEVKALRTTVGDFAGKRMHLVHFAGPIQPAWRDQLLASGLQIVANIPQNAYLVYGDSVSIAQLQAFAATAANIQWEGAYLPDFKIHPLARIVDEKGNPRQIGTDTFAVQMVADAEANTNTLQLIDQFKLETVSRQDSVLNYLNVIVRLSPANLSLLAARPDVLSIQPYFPRQKFCERQDQIIAGNLSGNVPSGPGYLAWLASKGFDSTQFTSFVVDVSDSGIDNGTTTPNHFGLYTNGTNGSPSRVAYNRLEGTPNSGSTISGCDGHGNLNSHIIGGYDNFSGFPFADTSGYHYGLGVCPFVSVGSSVIFDPSTFTSPVYNTLMSAAYQSKARISNNSWGANTAGAYDIDAQNYDALVRDAQTTVAGNQEMVIVFAAGNAGPGTKTVGSPGTAKNVITVGAGEDVQAFGGADGSGVTDAQANSANDLISFSSRGPCADGRHKPEITAPGTHVSGGVAQAAYDFAANPTGLANACFDGSGVSGGVTNNFFPPNQQFYTASSGTSHSTPCVAGSCALVRQYFINNFTNPPSPAMTKAYLMNSARYMTGASANDTLWSDNQGMGEMNLGTAFDGTARILRDEVAADLFTASGQTRTFTGFISDTNKPFRVTIAWTDAPGSTTGNAYNNNLDLTVTVGGNTYKGNVFSGAFSALGGVADTKNNAESVFLPTGVSGSFTVTVGGTSINSIGVPNAGNLNEQDFALVIYNGAAIAAPVIAPAGSTLTAETCFPTNGVIDPGETVTVNFTLQNTGSANTANVVATLQATGGITAPSAAQTYGTLIAGGAAVSHSFTFTPTGTCGSPITASLQLQDGTTNLGIASYNFTLGKFIAVNFTENFDGVTAPALPVGWTTTFSGAESAWATATTNKDTAPNAAYAKDPASVGLTELISPAISILSTSAVLTFHQNYNLEASSSQSTVGYDGGVLEIQLGSGSYNDILSAGGSFISGAYNRTIYSSSDGPFPGRQAWSGNSSGFITTSVHLPAAAAGQTIHLKWRCGTDTGNQYGGVAWYVDTISIVDGYYACCSQTADLGVMQVASQNPAAVGQNLNYTITVTNSGPQPASSVTVADTLPASVTFVSASPGSVYSAGVVSCNVGTLASGSFSNIVVTVSPTTTGPILNQVSVSSSTTDTNSANNSANLVTTVDAAPAITTQPTNMTVVVGTNASFQVAATGTAPLHFQWFLNGTNAVGLNANILSLTNIQASQAGNYTVLVTNIVGSVTSSAAHLTVLVTPTISSINGTATNISVTVASVVGLNYTLEYKNSLLDAAWTPLTPSTPGTGGAIQLHDPQGSLASRFYRVRAD
ncbi:MAG: conserved repeat domain protein [Pedosphaera sp.]|nr:conserved repeat domain protein [Pedosphaera sp.]